MKDWYFSLMFGTEWNIEFHWYPTFYWTNKHRCIHWMYMAIGWER